MAIATTAQAARCDPALRAACDLLCHKWTLVVVAALADGPQCFGELARTCGTISPRTLCLRLRTLEQHGLVRRVHPDGCKRSRYTLTARGAALRPLLTQLERYAACWLLV